MTKTANTSDDGLDDLRALLRGECPECGRRGEQTSSGQGAARVRAWTCEGPEDDLHDEAAWDEESVAQHAFDRGWSEDAVKALLARRGC